MGKRSANAVDAVIGQKIRQLRIENGLTMQEFAEKIGITQQQAHKYERGLNRVAVSRLLMIAVALQVPVGYFFDNMEMEISRENIGRQKKHKDLIKNFQAIQSSRHKEAVSLLVRILAEY